MNKLIFLLLVSHFAWTQTDTTLLEIKAFKRQLSYIEQKADGADKLKAQSKILNNISQRLLKNGQFDEGLKYAQTALAIAKPQGLYEQTALAEFNIAYAIQKKERFFEASSHFETAIEWAKKSRNDSLLAKCYHYEGMCYNDQGLPQKSAEMLLKELKIETKLGFQHQKTDCLNSLGLAYTKLNQPDSALYWFEQMLKIPKMYQDDFLLGVAHKNIGKILLSKNRETEALVYLHKAIDLIQNCEKDYLKQEVHYVYIVLAQFYQNKKQYALSIKYGKLTWKLVNLLNYSDQKVEVSKILYSNYLAIHNKDSALFYLEKYAESSLKINQDLLSEQHIAAEARFRDEQQKSQILLLNQEKIAEENKRKWLLTGLIITLTLLSAIGVLYRTIRKQKKDIEDANHNLEQKVAIRTVELQQALDDIKGAMLKGQTLERKRVASELHDNLGSLLSAIGVGMEVVDERSLSEKEQRIFKNIQQQIGTAYSEVRLLSHNLQPDELEKEGLKKALNTFAQKINQNQKIKITLDTDNIVPFSKEIEFALYSICLELINNTLKYASASELRIGFDQLTAHKWQMQVSDNGRGLQQDYKEGFGLRSIKNRIEAIGGSIQIVSKGGLAYLIDFEISQNINPNN